MNEKGNVMHRALVCSLQGIAACLVLTVAAWAGKWNAADYPMRVHVFQYNAHSHYYGRSLEQVDGEGRANLYENSQPKGFDFSYECSARIMGSAGFETYVARWKKPGRELEILLPVMGGKPGEMSACDLKVSLKEDTVYYRHNGLLGEEPAAKFKDWMVRHQYDPEHGLNEPVNPSSEPAQSSDAQQPAPPAGAGAGTH